MLRWPAKAWRSVAILFAPLQDVDVYVEDHESQVFYGELFKRLVGDKVSIVRAIPLGNRHAVETACASHGAASRPSLYLVDGDLDWVAGRSPLSLPFMYRLQAYCVENFLICELAAIELAVEAHGKIDQQEARNRLGWSTWVNELRNTLLDLSIVFAVAHVLTPDIRTVAHGHGAVCDQAQKGKDPKLNSARAASLRTQIMDDVVAQVGMPAFQVEYGRVRARVDALADPLRVVSGKNFLLPSLRFQIRSVAPESFPRRSFQLRLARHCDLSGLNGLRDAVLAVARRDTYAQSDNI